VTCAISILAQTAKWSAANPFNLLRQLSKATLIALNQPSILLQPPKMLRWRRYHSN